MPPPAPLSSCPACRALLEPGARTCPYCGRPILGRSDPDVPLRAVPGGLTRVLLFAIVLLYAAMLAVDAWTRPPVEEGEKIGLLPPSRETLRAFGILSPWEVFACGKVWLLVTPIFLHLDLVHLLFNAVSLRQLGPLAQEAFGPARFLAIYVATGVVGNVVSAACGWGGAGASGSIFGLMGAVLLFARRRRRSVGPALVYRWLTQWLLYAVLVSFLVPRVNHFAHGAGLASGLLLGALADRFPGARVWRWAARLAFPAVFACFAATALESPRVARGRVLVLLHQAVRAGARAAFLCAEGSVPEEDARVQVREAVRSLERPSGLGSEIEGFRERFARALRGFDAAMPGSAEREGAVGALVAAFEDYNAWVDANACAYGLRRVDP